MIFYINLYVNDLVKSGEFYDAFLTEFGAKRIAEREGDYIVWSPSDVATGLSTVQYRGRGPKPSGEGHLLAFDLETREDVDRLLARGLELGATLVHPAQENELGFYYGCIQDMDGHQLRMFCLAM